MSRFTEASEITLEAIRKKGESSSAAQAVAVMAVAWAILDLADAVRSAGKEVAK